MTSVITFPTKRRRPSEQAAAERMGRGVFMSPFAANGACVFCAIDHTGNRVVEMITTGSLNDDVAVRQLWDLLNILDPVGPEVLS